MKVWKRKNKSKRLKKYKESQLRKNNPVGFMGSLLKEHVELHCQNLSEESLLVRLARAEKKKAKIIS